MDRCQSCGRLKIGELQAICKYCGYSSGSDRWYVDDDHWLKPKLQNNSTIFLIPEVFYLPENHNFMCFIINDKDVEFLNISN